MNTLMILIPARKCQMEKNSTIVGSLQRHIFRIHTVHDTNIEMHVDCVYVQYKIYVTD